MVPSYSWLPPPVAVTHRTVDAWQAEHAYIVKVITRAVTNLSGVAFLKWQLQRKEKLLKSVDHFNRNGQIIIFLSKLKENLCV